MMRDLFIIFSGICLVILGMLVATTSEGWLTVLLSASTVIAGSWIAITGLDYILEER